MDGDADILALIGVQAVHQRGDDANDSLVARDVIGVP